MDRGYSYYGEVGRFVPGTFCPLGLFVSGSFCPWDVLSPGTFCPLGRFVLYVHPQTHVLSEYIRENEWGRVI